MRIGIIGCGTISRNVHLPVLLATPGVELAWLADTNRVSGQSLSHASGIPFHHIADARVDLPSADMVVIAIPSGAREAYYDYFEKYPDIAFYIEKPFAKSLAEHARIVGNRAPWQVAVGVDRRSFGLTRLLRELFLHRPFGKPLSIKIEFGGLGRILIGDSFMSNSVLAGGGALYQMGVHFLDAALFASCAEDVELRTGRMITENGMDIHVDAQLELKLSAPERLPLSILVTQLQATSNRIEIAFEGATVSFSIMYGEQYLRVTPRHSGASSWKLVPDQKTGPLDVFASFGLHWKSVIEALVTRTENYTSASQALLTSKAIELLYAIPAEGSHQNG
ncbi:MAG: Gfo/Idh/MocA family oxidoreductase [Proteobacteria bacterium]|nr:Gfo/Idh/MocA family oxidoreductase [Pseudomonadota bacterium]